MLTGGGFVDTWRPGAGSGFTFGLTETLKDAEPSFERRIDYVLARGLASGSLEHNQGEVTGDELATATRGPGCGRRTTRRRGEVGDLVPCVGIRHISLPPGRRLAAFSSVETTRYPSLVGLAMHPPGRQIYATHS